MLKISVLELFVAMIPETFVFIFGVYILANKPFEYRRIVITGLITGIATYFIRLLPIYPGTNLIFVALVMTALLTKINKIYIIKSVSSFLTLLVIRLVTEWLNSFLLIKILHLDLNELAKKPIAKTLAFLPSIILFALVVLVLYVIKYKKSQVDQNVPA